MVLNLLINKIIKYNKITMWVMHNNNVQFNIYLELSKVYLFLIKFKDILELQL